MMFKRSINILMICFAFSFIALSCADKTASLEDPFSVTVYVSNSMPFVIIYHLDKNNIQVMFSGGIAGETDSVLYEKLLSEEEQRAVINFFSDFPLSALEDRYFNPNIIDGDQKIFEFRIGKLEKRVQASNYYQEDLGALVEFINTLVSEKYKMWYLKY